MEASGTAPELWTNEAGKTSPDAINCQARNCYTPKVARCMWFSHRSRAIIGYHVNENYAIPSMRSASLSSAATRCSFPASCCDPR